VVAEHWSEVDGHPFLGPGGRVTVSRLSGYLQADICARRLGHQLDSKWIDPDAVAQDVQVFLSGAQEPFRLRGQLGYAEASSYERVTRIQLSFVFLLDRPRSQGEPGWRVAVRVPATRDRDLPDDGAIGAGTGNGCA